jgi:hypothetical protein
MKEAQLTWKMGASGSLLMATITLLSFMPAATYPKVKKA